ncbi:MAG: 50S ribosomal protein L10 [bacterium]|nr:50S ribosomal protein L10 [bacterium]
MAKAASMKYQAKAQKGKARKEAIIAEIAEHVKKAKGMVFTNYQGLTHRQLENLKKAVKQVEADYVATKNTLLLRALSSFNLSEEDKKFFEQPTATLFTYGDPIEPIKALAKSIKELKLPLIKFGILSAKGGSASPTGAAPGRDGWEIITSSQIERLATLPALPQLRAQLVGTLNSPIQGLHRALSWNMTMFVMTLKAIESKKASS